MVERGCELDDRVSCNADQLSFHGYIHRWMVTVAQLCPFVADQIWATLKTSTEGAVKACSGGPSGTQCGFRWTTGTYDGSTGAGQQMSALAALTSYLASFKDAAIAGPVSNTTGGTSAGDPNAGSGATAQASHTLRPITTGDRVGAGILTSLVLGGILGGTWALASGFGE
jgi:mannan endo-1,6-alpha-mannosidase